MGWLGLFERFGLFGRFEWLWRFGWGGEVVVVVVVGVVRAICLKFFLSISDHAAGGW